MIKNSKLLGRGCGWKKLAAQCKILFNDMGKVTYKGDL